MKRILLLEISNPLRAWAAEERLRRLKDFARGLRSGRGSRKTLTAEGKKRVQRYAKRHKIQRNLKNLTGRLSVTNMNAKDITGYRKKHHNLVRRQGIRNTLHGANNTQSGQSLWSKLASDPLGVVKTGYDAFKGKTKKVLNSDTAKHISQSLASNLDNVTRGVSKHGTTAAAAGLGGALLGAGYTAHRARKKATELAWKYGAPAIGGTALLGYAMGKSSNDNRRSGY